MTNTTAVTDTEAKAFQNIAANKGEHVQGFTPNPAATAADFEVGQVVSIYSRGYYRTGVVEKIGKKNVTVVYTTAGALTEAARVLDVYRSRVVNSAAHVEGVFEAAKRNWEYYTSEAEVDRLAARFPNQYPAERIERDKAAKREFRAQHPDQTAYAAAKGDAAFAETQQMAARIEAADEYFAVNFTRKSAAFGQVGV